MTYFIPNLSVLPQLLLLLFFTSNSYAKPVSISFQHSNKLINIDGKLADLQWEKATSINNFTLPWRDFSPQPTIFHSFTDDEFFYFAFNVTDKDIVLSEGFEHEDAVANEDRVEIFLSKDQHLTQYYCIEIDAKGRVLDYSAKNYRQFDSNWQMDELDVASSQNENGYIVEGKFPLKNLESLGITERNFYLGLFRADYHHQQLQGQTSKDKAVSDDIKWISWIDPKVSSPDFHIPEAFYPVVLAR